LSVLRAPIIERGDLSAVVQSRYYSPQEGQGSYISVLESRKVSGKEYCMVVNNCESPLGMSVKNPVKKLNVKPCKNRDLMIPDQTVLSGQGALILATVLVSWCALAFGTNTAQAQSPPPFPLGVWGPFGVGHDIPPG